MSMLTQVCEKPRSYGEVQRFVISSRSKYAHFRDLASGQGKKSIDEYAVRSFMEKNTGYCEKFSARITPAQCQKNKQAAPERCGDCAGIMLPATPQGRGSVLMKAHATINGERQDQYGNAEDNFKAIADFWNEYLSDHLQTSLTAHDVAMMMCLLKIARIKTGAGKEDSYVDLCGYAALAADIAAQEKRP